MDLRELLACYEVTAVPGRRPVLALVWSEADGGSSGDAVDVDGSAVLTILDDYRITRVPKAS